MSHPSRLPVHLVPTPPTTSSRFPLESLPPIPDKPSEQVKELGLEACEELATTTDRHVAFAAINKLIDVCSKGVRLYEETDITPALKHVRKLLHGRSSAMREACLRLLRHVAISEESIQTILSLSISLFVSHSLERYPKHLNERVQALKLTRHIITISPQLATVSLIKSVVVVASDPSDKLRRVCVETLRELSVKNALLVGQCNGFKALTHAALDSSLDSLSDSIVMTMLYLLNDQQTRRCLRPVLDIELFLSPITDFSKPPTHLKALALRKERIAMSAKAVATMMRSWTGILILTSSRHCGLTSLIHCLSLPPEYNKSLSLHDVVFDTISGILDTSTQQRDGVEISGLPPRHRGHNVLRNYSSVVLLALIHVGCVETLTITAKSDDETIARRSTALLGRMLMLASTILPPSHCAKLQLLPQLVGTAGSFEIDSVPRLRANRVLNDLHRVSREELCANFRGESWQGALDEKPSLPMSAPKKGGRPSMLLHTQGTATKFHLDLLVTEALKWRRMKGMDITSDRLEFIRRKLDANMDDTTFGALLNESNVSLTKDAERWRWDVVLELLEGALLNQARLKESMKETKFVKRLLSYIRPGRKLFCNEGWEYNKMVCVRSLCRVVEALVGFEDGVEFLRQSEVFQQIDQQLTLTLRDASQTPASTPTRIELAASFAAETISSATSHLTQPIHSSRRRSETTNSDDEGSTHNGTSNNNNHNHNNNNNNNNRSLRVMSRDSGNQATSVFDVDVVSHTMSREYFTILGFLTKTPTGINFMESIGLFSTLHKVAGSNRDDLNRLIISSLDYNLDGPCRVFLARLMTSGNKDIRLHCTRHVRVMLRAGVPDFDHWGIELLTTQLFDQDEEVALAALDVLSEACIDVVNLEALVKKRPMLKNLGKHGRAMMTRMMRTAIGLSYLNEMQWVEEEMERWARQANIEYVHIVELRLINAMNKDFPLGDGSDSSVVLPPHFFGELASTSQGVEILRHSGHFASFVEGVKSLTTSPLQKRSCLWCLGHIGASSPGLELLLEENVIEVMTTVSSKAQCLSLRGTCCYALGLLSRTQIGREHLNTFGWQSPPSLDSNISVPTDLNSFFSIPPCDFVGSPAMMNQEMEWAQLGEYEGKAFDLISKMSNAVTKRKAEEGLKVMKVKRGAVFSSRALFLQAHSVLATHTFQLATRRTIYDLFDDFDVGLLDECEPPPFAVPHTTTTTELV